MSLHFGKVGTQMTDFCKRLLQDESGQDLIEYALVAALIGLGAVVTVKSLGTKIAGSFTEIGTTLTTNT